MAIGVDTHKATLAAAAVDELGREVETRTFANDSSGHRAAFEWVSSFSEGRVVGIECSGSYGAALAWSLMDRGEDVREVPPALTWRERNRKRSDGKSDPVDALAIARVVAREQNLPVPKRAGLTVDLRLLNEHRDQLIRHRTRLANRAHRDLVILTPGYQGAAPSLRSKKNVLAAIGLIQADKSVRAELTRERLAQVLDMHDDSTNSGSESRQCSSRPEARSPQ